MASNVTVVVSLPRTTIDAIRNQPAGQSSSLATLASITADIVPAVIQAVTELPVLDPIKTKTEFGDKDETEDVYAVPIKDLTIMKSCTIKVKSSYTIEMAKGLYLLAAGPAGMKPGYPCMIFNGEVLKDGSRTLQEVRRCSFSGICTRTDEIF